MAQTHCVELAIQRIKSNKYKGETKMKTKKFKILCMVIVIAMCMSITPVFAIEVGIIVESESVAAETAESENTATITAASACLIHLISYDDKTTIKCTWLSEGIRPCKMYWAKRCSFCNEITGWVEASSCFYHG